MRKSNWIMKPQGSGRKFQIFLNCHHLGTVFFARRLCFFLATHHEAQEVSKGKVVRSQTSKIPGMKWVGFFWGHLSKKNQMVYPLKSNIDTQHDVMFEAGDTFSKAHHLWYLFVRFRMV